MKKFQQEDQRRGKNRPKGEENGEKIGSNGRGRGKDRTWVLELRILATFHYVAPSLVLEFGIILYIR